MYSSEYKTTIWSSNADITIVVVPMHAGNDNRKPAFRLLVHYLLYRLYTLLFFQYYIDDLSMIFTACMTRVK